MNANMLDSRRWWTSQHTYSFLFFAFSSQHNFNEIECLSLDPSYPGVERTWGLFVVFISGLVVTRRFSSMEFTWLSDGRRMGGWVLWSDIFPLSWVYAASSSKTVFSFSLIIEYRICRAREYLAFGHGHRCPNCDAQDAYRTMSSQTRCAISNLKVHTFSNHGEGKKVTRKKPRKELPRKREISSRHRKEHLPV